MEETFEPNTDIDNDYCLPLNSPDAELPLVGGKAMNLARLAGGGFKVPDGFIVSVNAYSDFVAHGGLARIIAEEIATVDIDDPTALSAHSDSLRAHIEESAIPAGLAAAVASAYAALGRPPVAVRSSATAEDLPEMSFAGLQDTFLNVQGEDSLLSAIAGCWSSLWTARAIAYRTRNGIDHLTVAIAVVVQKMVPSESSGVLFTANPLTGRRDETIIDATFGLGETLVSGQIEPDHYVVESESGRILQKRIGAKAKAMHGKADGGVTTMETLNPHQQAIQDTQIRRLAETGQHVAELLGSPQDIEWAFAGGDLFLLQSRPITSLFPLPPGDKGDALRVYVSFGAVQGVQGPFTPMGQDMLMGLFAGLAQLFGHDVTMHDQQLIHTAAERLWVDATGTLRNSVGRRFFLKAFLSVEPGAADSVRDLVGDSRIERGGMRLETLRRAAPFVVRIIGSLASALLKPEAAARGARRAVEVRIAEVEQRMRTAVTLAERINLFEWLSYNALFPLLISQFLPLIAVGQGSLAVLHWLASLMALTHDDIEPRLLHDLNRSLSNNVTTEMGQEMWLVASRVRQDPAAAAALGDTGPDALARDYRERLLPYSLQAALDEFLDRYGMRGPAEIDFGQPRWREKPAPVFSALQALLAVQDANPNTDSLFAAGQVAASRAEKQLAEAVSQTFGATLGGSLVRGLARRVRTLSGFRESPKIAVVRMMGIARAALLECGQELAEAGVLERSDDLFFLHLPEMKVLAMGAPGDWQRLVRTRRASYQREQRRQPIPRLLFSDGTAIIGGGRPASDSAGSESLVGSGVSPGSVEGSVRVVFDPADSRLQPGEILVCPGTDPSWTPLFLAAGGLVMEVGGMMTHGSVVAREYGIPAVVGVDRATERLHTGQRVRVDGGSGRVDLLDQV